MARRRERAAMAASWSSGRHEFRRKLSLGVLVVVALGLLTRAFQVSVLQHGTWSSRAESQHGDTIRVPSPRGTIYDRDGVPLAASREVYIVAIAPHEVRDTTLVIRKLRTELELAPRNARDVFRGRDRWVVLKGRFEETAREALDNIDGVHFERTMRRFYPHGELAAELLGRVNDAGDKGGGIEQEMDSVLAGHDGKAVKRLNSLGRPIPGAMVRVTQPVPGRDVTLTIDADLQEIATDALRDALETTGAQSGELLITDPHSGEILAAVSRRVGGRTGRFAWTAATAPYEPGSTIKPFTIASLLAEGRATLGDSLHGEHGSYRLHGRTITDVHGFGWLTLREAFLQSSNIVMAKAAARLEPDLQYRRLRDFGFGSPTGIGYPSESGGRLRRPDLWSKQSQASLAFGYEISVTPLQLVMAYGAIANGGVLMEPLLIREVRARDGAIYREAAPRAVRRVVSTEVAAQVRGLLSEVVERGTGTGASLGDWKVAGKTGTARFSGGGRYVPGAYISTFAGFFPAEDPQIVFLVKLDRPKGDYYGGLTAAPVTRATLQAALAARSTPLDRGAVAIAGPVIKTATPRTAASPRKMAATLASDRTPVVLKPARAAARRPGASGSLEVPDVLGASLRDALRELHAAGFRVRIEGSGVVSSTTPAAGASARRGAVITLRAEAG
jgi:cell division protein FtsI (penicillin-binding protein 3)